MMVKLKPGGPSVGQEMMGESRVAEEGSFPPWVCFQTSLRQRVMATVSELCCKRWRALGSAEEACVSEGVERE